MLLLAELVGMEIGEATDGKLWLGCNLALDQRHMRVEL
jgi:hypothetical protein